MGAYYREQTQYVYTSNKLVAGADWNFAPQIKSNKFWYLSHK